MAAVLACGPGAALSHGSAAALWRMLTGAVGAPEVLRTGVNREGPAGVRLRRTNRLEATTHHNVPITTPARTLLDLAATGSSGRLELALNEARSLRLVNQAALEALATSGRPGSRAIRTLLADAPGFTRQEAERRLKALILRAQLPRPLTNTQVCAQEADAFWPEHRLVLEVDGYAVHGRRDAFERDRRLDQQRAAAGYRTVRVTWRQLTGEPEAVVARLAGALARS
jgi:very-short-patch-repair endonuclease